MDPSVALPTLLGLAVLAPLISFFLILISGPRMGKAGQGASYIATTAIGIAAFLSFVSLFMLWLPAHYPAGHHAAGHHAAGPEQAQEGGSHAAETHAEEGHAEEGHAEEGHTDNGHADKEHAQDGHDSGDAGHQAGDDSEAAHAAEAAGDHAGEEGHAGDSGGHHGHGSESPHYAGEFNVPLIGSPWVLGQFGDLRLSISYYIDALTISMFCMVTFIATLIHIYASGYMHEELHDVTDHEVTLSNGEHLHRPGRYHRFFQYLSLFCFSMLGLVIAGNIAMVFVFWELVGVCSYFLIGFYVERKSASNAANKAFIVNRVGDFGMIIGLLVLWTTLGTFSFGDYTYTDTAGKEVESQGIFTLIRSHSEAEAADGMVRFSAKPEILALIEEMGPDASQEEIDAAIAEQIPHWRAGHGPTQKKYGYVLLIVAGLGIFAGCVGKSAQFPLHVWLPDAMEGPTPVSALVHSATMVAAGVYLVARFYPVFAPEVLLVIAVIGMITLFMAATIAITATDIKRVLAYSTVSQLGYMMMALGVGGWLAGVMHLITHAFFKSLLFMGSGSVIHAVHTNEMTEMGGLRKKMPVTAYTMLIGCFAIAGAGVPFLLGFIDPLKGLGMSGFYSKDFILEQAFSFMHVNPSGLASVFFLAGAGGAAITAFYMFRMWYLTFAGEPRNQERHDHAHESPAAMYSPLVILSVMAIAVAWRPYQGMIAAFLTFVALVAWRIACWFSTEQNSDHGHADHSHAGHEDGHGDHDGHHEELPAWIGNLPLYASLAVFFIAVVWWGGFNDVVLENLLEQARPANTLASVPAVLLDGWVWPDEHDSHVPAIVVPVSLIAIGTAFSGFFLATVMYCWGKLDPAEVKRQFAMVYRFLVNKWWFDELYEVIFIRPTHVISNFVSSIDRKGIDWMIDNLANLVKGFAVIWERIADRTVVDGLINTIASWTYRAGVSLRVVQTGSLRQYVMFIVIGALAIFVLISFFWNPTLAG